MHCKSTNEIGVQEAMEVCARKYLDRIINTTNAELVVCLGDKVTSFIKKKYQIADSSVMKEVPGLKKLFLFLPHPNARKERRLDKILTPEQLQFLREKVM